MEKYIKEFETHIHDAVYANLLSQSKVDERMPDMPDIEEQWERIAQSYLPDGVREFSAYPLVSLGWMMYVGMAVAQKWDEEWETFLKEPDLYLALRDKRGYDNMDEYIREEVLGLKGDSFVAMEKLVGKCAEQVHHALMREHLEAGTPLAFHAYVACIHQMYLLGAAVQLLTLGYKMQKLG